MNTIKIWVPRRSATKQTFVPALLDCVVADTFAC
jgi:hypothetical protein